MDSLTMQHKPGHLSRNELERGRLAPSRRGGWKACIWTTVVNGQLLLVKDVRHSHPVYRWVFGRLLLWHEWNMNGYVRECEFVPRVAGWLDWDAFAIERVDATSLSEFKKPRLTCDFYDRLQACVDRLHAIGVVHLDLRYRRNVMARPDGSPVLVDFGNALYIGRSWLSRRVLIPLLGAIDHSAVLKFRQRDFPDSLTRRQQARHRAYRLGRMLWPWGRLWQAVGINRAIRPSNRGRASSAAAEAMSGQPPVQDVRT